MKKTLILLISLFIGFSSSVFSQNNLPGEGKKTLLLMYPTIGTISGINELIEKKIFPLENYQIKGIYFENEGYDYSASEAYIAENNLDIKLEECKGNLEVDNLFTKNDCSGFFEKVFLESEGVIFFGGPDIPPAVYGEKTNTLTVIFDPYRHYFESSFLFHLLGGFQDGAFIPLLEKKPDYFILGFCLGMQTMNVATGGSMIQDIPQEVYKLNIVEDILKLSPDKLHRNYNSDIQDSLDLFRGAIHPIKIINGSWIEKENMCKAGTYPSVLSSHHQAVEKIGKNLRVVATSIDGKIIESLDHKKYPNVFGFQFHPEASDIYSYEYMYQIRPDDKKQALRSYIESGNGYDFHLAIWKKFGGILNSKSKVLNN